MILEGLVSTRNPDGTPHLAPMGPRVDGVDFQRFVLRPFPTSRSYHNLLNHPKGVLHVTDDVLLIARAAIGLPIADALWGGLRLNDCHRYCEFRVASVDASEPRIQMFCDVIHRGDGTRHWFGFNRARHAVLEAAILATRVHLLPHDQIESEFRVLNAIVEKTGGIDEKKAIRLLRDHVRGSS